MELTETQILDVLKELMAIRNELNELLYLYVDHLEQFHGLKVNSILN